MGLAVLVSGLVGLCVLAATVAQRALGGGVRMELGVLDLQLIYNPGAAFSLGAGLPAAALLAVTAVISVGLAGYLFVRGPGLPVGARLGLSAVLAGALANLTDRAGDGVVTDYLHTGWWPTFNLPDTLITLGGAALVLSVWRTPTEPPAASCPEHDHAAPGPTPSQDPGRGEPATRSSR